MPRYIESERVRVSVREKLCSADSVMLFITISMNYISKHESVMSQGDRLIFFLNV